MPKSSVVVGKKKYARKQKAKTRPGRVLIVPLAIIAALIVLGVAGFSFAAGQEEDNAFCASCHSQPESTYYQRFQASTAVDLASDHYLKKQTKCIDCHSGEGTGGRISAMMMGARNAALWFSGTAKQPAPLTFPIPDANCLKCHQDSVKQSDPNHFHVLLSRWQLVDPNAATCVSCHGGHATDGDASIALVNQTRTEQV